MAVTRPSLRIGDVSSPHEKTALFAGFIITLLAVKLGAHVVTNLVTPYEFHRDELLYLAMGTHFRLFHMDFPPLIALLGSAARAFGSTSLFAVRMVPALAGTVSLLLTLLMVRELGGRRPAQLLAALAVMLSPLFLRTANLFQPVALDQLWWTLGFYAVIKLRNTDDPRWWLVLGAAGGLGLLTKFSILFFGLAVLLGLLLTEQRSAFRGRWPWIAMLMALVIGLPSVAGQVNLGFPVVGQLQDLRTVQLQRTTLGDFLMGQVLFGPGFILAVVGVVALLVHPTLRRYRVAGWIAFVSFAVIAALQGKSYYVGPLYPMLYAAGAVTLERLAHAPLRRVALWGVGALIMAWGAFSLPFGLPILPPEPMARYATATGITSAVTTNRGVVLRLPQDYGDMLGWKSLVGAAADVYQALPAEDKQRTILYGANYGEAGALDLYGPALGLPPVVSMAGSFYFFGPGDRSGDVVLFVGVEPEHIDDHCGTLDLIRFTQKWTVEENDVPIVVCREPNRTVQEVWEMNREAGARTETRRPET